MKRSQTAGAVHTQYRFAIAKDVEVRPGKFYGFNAAGKLVKPQDADAGRKCVYSLETATGDAAETTRALCAVSVVAIVVKGTLTASDLGKRVYAATEDTVIATDNTKPCGWLLGIDADTAAIQLG